MGKIKPDLAGAYVSKVGGVAYYIKDGVNYVRSLSKSEYKSNTPLQAEVKARFKRPGVADLYSKLSGDAGRKQLPSG